MKLRLGLALGLVLAVPALGVAQQATTTPKDKLKEGWWAKLHESFLERAKKGDVDLLFLGDSITQGWNNNEVWKRHYEPRKSANFGIGGDRTEHVLWRIENGELEGISPKLVVLMIGTNNISANTPEDIAEGVKAIVGKLREKLPKAKILLLGVFPRARDDKKSTELPPSPIPGMINEKIAKLDDGSNVKYLDIGKSFLNEKGQIPKDVMPDFLHLSGKGYRAWADAIEPAVWSMLDEPKK
jgi:lysophospholipase L1-like esterase